MIATEVAPLIPRAQEWPEKPQERVTLLCEGPSAFVGAHELLAHSRGPVVAINRAIAFSPDIPIDFWATTDDPRNLWEWGQPYLHEKTRLFTTLNNLMCWDEMGVEATRIYHWRSTYMDNLVGADGLAPLIPTLFPVLAWILQQGTKEVLLLGADMIGSGTPGIDFSPLADEGHALRWSVERRMLALSMRQYRTKGSRIRRWNRSRPLPR